MQHIYRREADKEGDEKMDMVKGIVIPNSAGLVTTTAVATGDLLHTLSVGASAKIRKIMWSNLTGGNITLILGTNTNAGVFVPLFPTIQAVTGFDGVLTEREIPDVIFNVDRTPAPLGLTGAIFVVSSVAGVLMRLSVEEVRA
jgi:hypothetical protein